MILCRRIETPEAGTAWIAVRPVNAAAFGDFVRRLNYFQAPYWEGNRFEGEAGGDVVLRRIGYRWSARFLAVAGVHWGEARAYSASVGGRLPWFREWQILENALPEIDRSMMPPESGMSLDDWISGHAAAPRGEWCHDWYNPNGMGPDIQAQPPQRRLITGAPGQMVPRPPPGVALGFRLCFDEPACVVWSAGRRGWDFVRAIAVEQP